MTYEELVEKVKKTYESADAKKVKDHVAVQFNIEGEAEGAFYLEVADGKVTVAPFEYYDKDVVVITSAAVVSDIADGKTDIETAYNSGSLRAEGNVEKALLLKELKVKKTAAKKTITTKAATKTTTKSAAKTTAKKDDTKTAAKKTTKKAEVKETAETKKAEVKETAEAKKAEVKEAAKEEKKEVKKEVKKEAKAEEKTTKTTAKKTTAAKTTKKSTK